MYLNAVIKQNINYPAELKDFKQDCAELSRKLPVVKVMYCICYWQNFTALHQLFMRRYGVENADIILNEDDLNELLGDCEKIDDNHELAKDLLPTTDGIYDTLYFQKIEYTIKLVRKAVRFLQNYGCYNIYYNTDYKDLDY